MLNLYSGVQARLERTAWFHDVLDNAAEEVEHQAYLAAPLVTGTYLGKFRRFVARDNPNERIVENYDAGAIPIEFGSVNNQEFAPLRRGARAAGLDFTEAP